MKNMRQKNKDVIKEAIIKTKEAKELQK